jgi:hypothetical protein
VGDFNPKNAKLNRSNKCLEVVEGCYLLTPDDVFRLHPKVRWAALSTASGSVVFSQMRKGVESYTPNSDDRAFMEIGPLLISGVAERLSPENKAGKLECVIACFERDCVLLAMVKDGQLAISADKHHALTVFQEILPQILKLGA